MVCIGQAYRGSYLSSVPPSLAPGRGSLVGPCVCVVSGFPPLGFGVESGIVCCFAVRVSSNRFGCQLLAQAIFCDLTKWNYSLQIGAETKRGFRGHSQVRQIIIAYHAIHLKW